MTPKPDLPRSGRTETRFITVVGAFVAVGAVLRLRQFLFARSLWLDEAMLALNVASRSFADLFLPLDLHQNSPILFLLIEKCFVLLFGVNELALRAFPMLCGLALLPLIALAGNHVGGRAAAVAAVSLAAVSPSLIRYANEVKPYGVDAFATVVLLLLALRLGDNPTRGAFLSLALGAPVLAVLSNPSAFVCVSVWIGLLIRFRGDRAATRRVVLMLAVWALIFLAAYLGIARTAATDPLLKAGYHQGFLPPTEPSFKRLPLMVWGTFIPPFVDESVWILRRSSLRALVALSVFVASVLWIARRRGAWVGVMLGLPLVAASGAAALGFYPLGVPSLMVFFAPCVLLSLGGALALLAPRLASNSNAIGALVLWCLLLFPAWRQAWRLVRVPFIGQDFRSAYLAYKERSRGEPVYVGAKTQPSWLFYSTDWKGHREPGSSLWTDRLNFYFEAGGTGLSFDNALSRGGRVPKGEGRDLVYTFQGRTEVLGISSGRHWSWPEYVTRKVDDGWADNEAERLRDAAVTTGHPCLWLIFGHTGEGAYGPLREALISKHGFAVSFEKMFRGAAVARLCSPPPLNPARPTLP